MEDKIKGIALLLFGILLSCAQDGLNDTIFASMSDIPFAFVGLCVGIAGLCLVFGKQRCTRGYKRYKETSGLIEWKECQIFHSIFT